MCTATINNSSMDAKEEEEDLEKYPTFPEAEEEVELESSSTTDVSPQRSSPLTYHDHSDVKEDDVGKLVRQNFVSIDGNGSIVKVKSELDDQSTIGEDETVASLRNASSAKSNSNKRKSTSGPRGGVYEPFPLKLHRMLATVEEAGLSGAVSWKSHGRAFQVNHVNQFVQTILPKFFRQTKLTSFQRQLNLYGFRRIIHGTDSGAYYHELFLRGKPFLCRAMVRTKVKGKSRLRASDLAGTEPDFYKMTPLPLLTADDYKKSKNVFFSSSPDQADGEGGSPNSKVDSTDSSTKRRRSMDGKGFDPFDPFSEDNDRSHNHNDPQQHHWGGGYMRRSYQDQSNMHHLDYSQPPMPPVSNYPPNSQSGWPWQGGKPDKAVHSSSVPQDRAMPPSMMQQHTGQRNSSMSDHMSKSSNPMMNPNQPVHQHMYDMMMPPFSSQNHPQNSPPSATNPPYYYPPMGSAYDQHQSHPPVQNPYWSYNQYQTEQPDYHGNQDDQSQYSARSMPPTSVQRNINAPYQRETYSSQRSLPAQQNDHYNANNNSHSNPHNSQPVASSNVPSNTHSGTFTETMSPMKLQTGGSGEQNDTIELEVDGDMKELLNAFMKKKEN